MLVVVRGMDGGERLPFPPTEPVSEIAAYPVCFGQRVVSIYTENLYFPGPTFRLCRISTRGALATVIPKTPDPPPGGVLSFMMENEAFLVGGEKNHGAVFSFSKSPFLIHSLPIAGSTAVKTDSINMMIDRICMILSFFVFGCFLPPGDKIRSVYIIFQSSNISRMAVSIEEIETVGMPEYGVRIIGEITIVIRISGLTDNHSLGNLSNIGQFPRFIIFFF